MELQRLDHLGVAELEHRVALLDDRDPGAQSAANIEAYSMPMTPAPTTTIVSGTRSRRQDPVGVEDRPLVELDVWPGAPDASRSR